ncbi:hypothetical protein HOY80DRAFT_889687 [Tuber brumale]|nr:hypothetical protein HOY80DRAFT_889687 [Tuber brumale]
MPGQMPTHMNYSIDSNYYPGGYLYHQMAPGYGSVPQTSPRPSFQPMSSPVPPYIQPFTPGAPMSRTPSTNMDMHSARPNSSLGQPPTPSHTPQPINMQPPTPQHSSNAYAYPQKKRNYKVEIKNPLTGSVVHYDEVKPPSTTPPVVTTAPLIVSSPSPAPGRAPSRDSPHTRPASKVKGEQEKTEEMKILAQKRKEEMKVSVQKRIEEQRQEEQMLEKQRLEAEKIAKEEQERLAKEAEEKKRREEEERLRKEEEEKLRKEAEERALREEEERRRKAEEAEAARIAKEKEEAAAREAARVAKEKEEEDARIKAEVEKKAKEEEEAAKVKAEAEAKAAEALKASSTPIISKPFTPDNETMPPPTSRVIGGSKPKPSPLNLQIKTSEPGPPSAALTSLKSARFIEDINSVNYPANILSPNPALNPAASGKFKYPKDFLMQFKDVFTEKPSVDWDQKMRETVGEPDSARPQTTRNSGGSMAPRGSTPRTAASNAQPPMGPMGAFGSFKTAAASMITSTRGFERSSTTGSLPPGGLIFNPRSGGSGSGGGSGLMRTGSSTSLSGGNTPASPRTGNRSSRSSSRRGGGAPMEKTESKQGSGSQPTIPLAEVKPLPISENRWKPPSATKAAESAAVATPSEDNRLSPEMVQRKVKAALNKMTPEKFDKISDQILEITSQSKYETDGRTLRQVIQLTFEKATDEAAWSSMYAKFCKRMLEAMDPSIKDENIRDRSDNLVTGGSLFRKYLLNRCQEEFERGWKVNLPPKPEGVSDEAAMLSDEYYIAAAAKRRGLGLVQFIGELFKLGMLTERIMNECVRKLLDFEGVPEDETVESLVKLLRTIGRALDASEKSKNMMDMYFSRIKLLIGDKDLNSRMRFMLMAIITNGAQDVIDLRSKEWETKETDKGPKTIQEVREDALKAQQEKEAATRANQRSRPGGGGRGGDTRSFSGGGYGNNMHHQGGWQDNSKVNTSDLEKLSSRARPSNRMAPPTFGPPGMYSRSTSGSGSRRGLGPPISRGPEDSHSSSRTATPAPPNSSKNPFSPLGESHHDSGETNEATSPSITSSPPTANARIRSPPLMEEAK